MRILCACLREGEKDNRVRKQAVRMCEWEGRGVPDRNRERGILYMVMREEEQG